MRKQVAIKIIFYGLVIGAAFATGLLYYKSTTPKVSPTPVTDTNLPPDTNALAGNLNQNTPATNTTATDSRTNIPTSPPAKPSCIITIDGQRYDVQPLRSTHTGGDIFVCNTDMSSVFHSEHGNNLRMIKKYLAQ